MFEARVDARVEQMVPALARVANHAATLDPEEFGKTDLTRAVRALAYAEGARDVHEALVRVAGVSLAWVHRLNMEEV